MKTLRIVISVVFISIILLPLLFFNFTPDTVSLIDNRKLAENPFASDGDLTQNIENYVNDRIGFRDTMISAYTTLNDKLFGKMVHPSYSYGKDGFVFGAGITTSNSFGDFHTAFADMVKSVQDYCENRDVPFLFVFNPAKPAVYPDKIAKGVNYNREWVTMFFAELDKRGINYLDNTETLSSLSKTGTEGFNKQFDANHWNDIGAFYGTQKMLERLNEQIPAIHVNDLSEFSVSETLETSLLVSNFPIHEYVPLVKLRNSYQTLTSEYASELELHPSHRGFGYYINAAREAEDSPKTLVFQGSYMNGKGYKYLINALGEYIHIHDYQNVIDFPYYFNIFQPECVIFEAGEYTLSNHYFDYENMKAIDYNPPLSSLIKTEYTTIDIASQNITVEKGNTLTKIKWETDDTYHYAWLTLDQTYDMKAVPGGYQVTVETSRFESANNSLTIFVSDN